MPRKMTVKKQTHMEKWTSKSLITFRTECKVFTYDNYILKFQLMTFYFIRNESSQIMSYRKHKYCIKYLTTIVNRTEYDVIIIAIE